MKKLLLTIVLAISGANSIGQVPTNGLIFRQDYTGNFSDTSTSNATIVENGATLTTDEYNTTASAGNFDLQQRMVYPFSYTPQLIATTQLSISVKVYVDPVWFSSLASGQYVTFLTYGDSYMRILKTGSGYLLQCGVFNNNPTAGSYGYLGVSGASIDLATGWNTITMTYGPELPPNLGGALRTYVNGVYLGNTMRAVIVPDNQPVVANPNQFLVLGRASTPNQNFKGKLDRVLVYNRCLHPSEVLAIQNEGQSLTEYTFDNTFNNKKGTEPFFASSGLTFVPDRHGNPNGALNFSNINGTEATILNLPYYNYPRTISIWVKPNNIVNGAYNYPFYYGDQNKYFLAHYTGNSITASSDSGYVEQTNSNLANVWMHLAFVYDGANMKIYKNGVPITSNTSMSVSTNRDNSNNKFKLGYGNTSTLTQLDAALDDLKIYKYPLSDAEVLNLYNTNNATLYAENVNSKKIEAIIYPNPTSGSFSIKMENELKSVEIYSLQGQKIMTSVSKNINLTSLPKGIYLVKIEDRNKGVATQKLIIK